MTRDSHNLFTVLSVYEDETPWGKCLNISAGSSCCQ